MNISTAVNSDKPLERAPLNPVINNFIKQTSKKIGNQPNLSGHSFRTGFALRRNLTLKATVFVFTDSGELLLEENFAVRLTSAPVGSPGHS